MQNDQPRSMEKDSWGPLLLSIFWAELSTYLIACSAVYDS